MAASTPLQGKVKPPTKKTPTMGAGKGSGKPNGNIMSFFKKAESTSATVANVKEDDELLFVEDSPIKGGAKMSLQTPTPPREESSTEAWPMDIEMDSPDSPISRYNEDIMPSKRRRTDDIPKQSPPIERTKHAPARGPFVDDSDSDSDDGNIKPSNVSVLGNVDHPQGGESAPRDPTPAHERQLPGNGAIRPAVPILKRERTSLGEANDFDGIEDFIDDEFPEEGEEYLERRWMEEQAEFEEDLEEEDHAMGGGTMDAKMGDLTDTTSIMPQGSEPSSCPICGGNTAGLNDQV